MSKVLVAIAVGFAISVPLTFWLLKKVRIKSKARHFQVSLAIGLPTALFVFLLQTTFVVPVVVITVTGSLLVIGLELTLHRKVSNTCSRSGLFSHGKPGHEQEYPEAKEAAGNYPYDYLTEDFWMEQKQARMSLDEQKLEIKKNNPHVTLSHEIAQGCSVDYGEYKVRNGFRNTTDVPEFDSQDFTRVFLLGGSPLSGPEVPDRLTSSSFLQRIANENKVKIRVINCGWDGSGVLGRTELLKDLVVAKSIVVFVFGCNDSGWYDRKARKLSVDNAGWQLRALQLLVCNGSALAFYLYDKVSPWYYRKNSSREVKSLIETFKIAYEICISNSAKMIAILEPNLYTRRLASGYENRLLSRFNRDLRTLIAESYKQYEHWIKTIPYGVSATHIFDNAPASVFLDWAHVNARGNEIIAKFIFEELQRRGMLGKDSKL
jgi:hypothetical protein